MRDTEGVEWLLATEAAVLAGVKPSTIRTWVDRGKIQGRAVYRRLWVLMPDVWAAEHATRGHYLAQRRAK